MKINTLFSALLPVILVLVNVIRASQIDDVAP